MRRFVLKVTKPDNWTPLRFSFCSLWFLIACCSFLILHAPSLRGARHLCTVYIYHSKGSHVRGRAPPSLRSGLHTWAGRAPPSLQSGLHTWAALEPKPRGLKRKRRGGDFLGPCHMPQKKAERVIEIHSLLLPPKWPRTWLLPPPGFFLQSYPSLTRSWGTLSVRSAVHSSSSLCTIL